MRITRSTPSLLAAFAFATHAPAITIDDTVSFTTSPSNQVVGSSPYTFSASPDLDGFDPSGSDKLIFLFSSENAESVADITYGGVPMLPAAVGTNGIQFTGIYYLDDPPAAGGLVVQFSGSSSNGVGGSLIAVSGVRDGLGAANSNPAQTVGLTTTAAGSLVVAAHANNGGNGAAQSPLTPLFDGPVGSAGGGTGYQLVDEVAAVDPTFTGSTDRPVTAAVEFPAGDGADDFRLAISRNGTGFDFSWPSQSDKLYDLVSAPDLSAPFDEWSVYDDGSAIYGDLEATPSTNTLTGVAGDGARRFFAVIEKSPTVAVVETVRVFLVAGQSNADGRAAPSGLPTRPVNLRLPQDDVDFYYKVEGRAPALTTLRPGLSETNGFGPSITFGRALADQLGDGTTTRVALIKYANGGTNLASQWTAGGDASTRGDGPEYVTFQQTVANGLEALAAAHPSADIGIEGMIWLQGESDIASGASLWNDYQTNLADFIDDIGQTYGATLPFLLIRLSDGQAKLDATGLEVVRAAQQSVAEANSNADWVDTDGFGMKGDNLHFDAAGQQSIGTAAATTMLGLLP
jgi:hypothetical protein